MLLVTRGERCNKTNSKQNPVTSNLHWLLPAQFLSENFQILLINFIVCFTETPALCQRFPTYSQKKSEINSNQEIVPLKTFINRNPRNLERLALANKDVGWGLAGGNPTAQDYPRRNYYHR